MTTDNQAMALMLEEILNLPTKQGSKEVDLTNYKPPSFDVVTYRSYNSLNNTIIPIVEVWKNDCLAEVFRLYCFAYPNRSI